MKITIAALLLGLTTAWAQAPAQRPAPPPPIHSPEVHEDKSVTFRFRDPNAKEVMLGMEGAKALPMEKDDQGVWSFTTKALAPDYYGYSIQADGVSLIDPNNFLLKPNLLYTQSMVHVPGPPSLPWELNDVPHGVVQHRLFKSSVVGDQRDFYVYTPPGYDPAGGKRYPVLYLLHGYSDDASGWTAVGRANVIMDNLIAQGQAKPMIVVMPLGYGAPEIVTRDFGGLRDPGLRKRNYDRFQESLFTEVIPMVEKDFKADTRRDARAIVGLSMGGAESLLVGLNNLDRFAWVGSFSAGGASDDFNATFPNLDEKANAKLHLLWVACGTEDGLIDPNRKFRAWLASRGVKHVDIETPGMHTWMVWRRNLASFAPLLFQN